MLLAIDARATGPRRLTCRCGPDRAPSSAPGVRSSAPSKRHVAAATSIADCSTAPPLIGVRGLRLDERGDGRARTRHRPRPSCRRCGRGGSRSAASRRRRPPRSWRRRALRGQDRRERRGRSSRARSASRRSPYSSAASSSPTFTSVAPGREPLRSRGTNSALSRSMPVRGIRVDGDRGPARSATASATSSAVCSRIVEREAAHDHQRRHPPIASPLAIAEPDAPALRRLVELVDRLAAAAAGAHRPRRPERARRSRMSSTPKSAR